MNSSEKKERSKVDRLSEKKKGDKTTIMVITLVIAYFVIAIGWLLMWRNYKG